MSRLKKERLNQMIENALSYKQEVRQLESKPLYKKFKSLNLRSNFYGLTFVSLIISCLFIPQIIKTRNLADINQINDYVTFRIIEDL